MSISGNSVLIIYEKPGECKKLAGMLGSRNFRVTSATNGYTGLEYMSFEHFDVIIVSASLPLMKIEDFIPRIRKTLPFSKLIILGRPAQLKPGLVEKYNIFEFLNENPPQQDFDRLVSMIKTALEVADYKIIGSCQKMRSYFTMLEKIMKSSVTVLIYGESGTGKELTARALHAGGVRAGHPFVTVNCATIPENLLESELFGHEKGSFTGAVQRRIGKFEHAHQGSIFLDEIGELSPLLQAKFLRVLEEQAFERVGGNETVRVDVRIISATNRNLKEMVEKSQFREDLYYRLNAIPIHVPPLRERREDIIELVAFFMEKHLSRTGKHTSMTIETDALDILKRYSWPGNVRELENVIMRAMVLSENLKITANDLPAELSAVEPVETGIKESGEGAIRRVCSMAELEKEAIIKALQETNYNAAQASKLLKIGRMTFYRKTKTYSIRLR